MSAIPNPERHKRIGDIFDAVVNLHPDDRPARLAELCGNDAGLRAEVDALIAADIYLPDEAPEQPSFYGHAPAGAFETTIDPYPAGRVVLSVVEGPHAGATFTFASRDLFLVGRSRRAHFHLPTKDPYVSRIHFLLETNPPRARVLDMRSHNGTSVNGSRVEDAELGDGDRIKAGRTIFRVTIHEEPTADPPAVAAATKSVVAPSPDVSIEESNDFEPAEDLPFIPGYHLTRELGRGAMGIVYQGVRETDNMPVAVKAVCPPVAGNPNDVQRFLREAEILQQLDHPTVVRYLDLGATPDLLYFVMEYVAGTNLEHIIREKGQLPVKTAVRLILPVLDALAYAHARGFIHRDVKPANVLLTKRPDGRKAIKLVDFGLAKVYQMSKMSGVTMPGETGGTPAYMAPEQITNFRDAAPPADQYAAGAMLYHMIAGAQPYDLPPGMPAALLMILRQDPVPLTQRVPNLPPSLVAAVNRALQREPQDRFPDVTEFAAALWPFSS